jgi:hypothetical protein
MTKLLLSLVLAGGVVIALPRDVAAQCAGGTTVAGYYLSNGTYVPSHCFDPYPTPLGLLYPSGAQWMPTIPPAAGPVTGPGSPLPGQWLGPGAPQAGPDTVARVGPGPSPAGSVSSPQPSANASTVPGYTATGQPRAVEPAAGTLPAAAPPVATSSVLVPRPVNPAYSFSLPAAPPRAGNGDLARASATDHSQLLAVDQESAPEVIADPDQ